AQLIKSEPQCQEHLQVELFATAAFHMALQEEIEQSLPPENAQRQLGCQRRIGFLDSRFELRVEEIGRVSVFGGYAAQNVKPNLPRSGNSHKRSLIAAVCARNASGASCRSARRWQAARHSRIRAH